MNEDRITVREYCFLLTLFVFTGGWIWGLCAIASMVTHTNG